MTTRETIQDLLTKGYSKYKNIAHRYYNGKDDPDDIVQETMMYILELKDEEIERIIPFLDRYIVQIIKFSFIGEKSAYQQKYNRMKMQTCDDVNFYADSLIADDEYNIDDDKLISQIEEILLDKCTWYQAEVFRTNVVDGKSFSQISKENNIPASSLWKTYNEAVEIINKNLK